MAISVTLDPAVNNPSIVSRKFFSTVPATFINWNDDETRTVVITGEIWGLDGDDNPIANMATITYTLTPTEYANWVDDNDLWDLCLSNNGYERLV